MSDLSAIKFEKKLNKPDHGCGTFILPNIHRRLLNNYLDANICKIIIDANCNLAVSTIRDSYSPPNHHQLNFSNSKPAGIQGIQRFLGIKVLSDILQLKSLILQHLCLG